MRADKCNNAGENLNSNDSLARDKSRMACSLRADKCNNAGENLNSSDSLACEMKIVYVSQRADVITDYKERRDALDQRWAEFLLKTGAIAFPMPNNVKTIALALEVNPPEGILLTGGNSPAIYGGNAPERDAADVLLLDYALENNIPLIGVCRGFQSILTYFGGALQAITSHVAVRHDISGRINKNVNSYHNLAAKTIPECFDILAVSDDNIVEAIVHKTSPIIALMWHPEREDVFCEQDINMFRKAWGK